MGDSVGAVKYLLEAVRIQPDDKVHLFLATHTSSVSMLSVGLAIRCSLGVSTATCLLTRVNWRPPRRNKALFRSEGSTSTLFPPTLPRDEQIENSKITQLLSPIQRLCPDVTTLYNLANLFHDLNLLDAAAQNYRQVEIILHTMHTNRSSS